MNSASPLKPENKDMKRIDKVQFIVLSLFFLLGCSRNKDEVYQDILRPVKVERIGTPQSLDKIYTGVVEAEEFAQLAFKVGGPLVEMNVDAGETIKKGTIVAVVDPLDYQLQNDANQAAYVTARSQLERDKKLLDMEAISRQDYEVSLNNYVKARSAFQTSQNTLQDTRLKAPFEGFVEKKYVENYQKVQAGEPIIKLVNPDKLAVRFILPETSVGLTREKMNISVEFDVYRGYHFQARIQEFIDASPGGGGIPVKLVIEDTLYKKERFPVYPGFSARIHIQIEEKVDEHAVVPLNAVFIDPEGNVTSVWIYEPETATVRKRRIEIVQLFGQDKVMVKKGLKQGDVVVIDGVNFITDGQKVQVIP